MSSDNPEKVAALPGPASTRLKAPEVVVMLAISGLLLAASYRQWWSIGVTEAWGFVTGGICVWLVVLCAGRIARWRTHPSRNAQMV
jgi:hypothetical protein